MKRITFLLLMLTIQVMNSQDITFTGNLTVTTQAEIDALPENYTHITGRLDILGNDGDISDLSKFSDLIDVGRRLLIQDCPLLTDLTGLSSLEAVGSLDANEELVIRRMEGLTTLNGLQSLTSVGRRVGIRQNPALTTLEGLNNLVSIGENKITIGDDDCDDTDGEDLGNDGLTDYCALESLINNIGISALEAGGSCITNNEAFNPSLQDIADGNCTSVYSGDLTVTTQAEIDALPINYTHITGKLDILGGDGDISDLSKFSNLKDIGGRLLIQDCPLLTNLTGLDALEIIGSASIQELAIRRMDGLVSLDGLQSLKEVSRRIGVWENPVLQTLEGLNNLEIIRDNMVSESDGLIRIGTTSESGANPSLTDFCALTGIINIIGATALDDDPLSYINNYTTFNPTFTEISNGNCSTSFSVDLFTENNIELYPNPAQALLKIKSSINIDSVSIFSISGKELIKSNALVLDISGLSNGIYIVKINSGNKFVSKKIIKQ